MKYSVPDHSEEYKQAPESKEIGVAGGKKVKILSDGSIEATAFVDKDHQDLDYGFDEKKNVPFFKKNINENLRIKFIPNVFKVYYEAVCKKAFSIVGGFAKFIGKVKKIPLESMGRYKHAHKTIRRGIKKLLKDKKRFLFTKIGSHGERVSLPYVENTILGPYNYPVKLKVQKEAAFIKDLLVIKTGGFNDAISRSYNKETAQIVYVSPHVEKTLSGVVHTSTGVNLSGNAGATKGQNLNDGIASGVKISYLTSEDYLIPSGNYLSGSIHYKNYISSDGNSDYSVHIDSLPPDQTLLKTHHPNSFPVFASDVWDGVVPSGAWVSVESWSYTDQYVGFDGEILVEPVDQSLGVSLSDNVTFVAEDARGYEEAYEKAEKGAANKFYRKLNKKLIENGIKTQGSRHKKFDNMIYKSAQGYYDKGNNQLVNNYDLNDSANPTGQNFLHKEDKTASHVSEKSTTTTTTSSSSSSSSSGGSY